MRLAGWVRAWTIGGCHGSATSKGPLGFAPLMAGLWMRQVLPEAQTGLPSSQVRYGFILLIRAPQVQGLGRDEKSKVVLRPATGALVTLCLLSGD